MVCQRCGLDTHGHRPDELVDEKVLALPAPRRDWRVLARCERLFLRADINLSPSITPKIPVLEKYGRRRYVALKLALLLQLSIWPLVKK